MEIICRNYEHYNRAMGKYIRSKSDYIESMKRGGYIPLEESQRLADEKQAKISKWVPSKDCIDVMKELYDTKKKTIRLCEKPKVVEAMKKRGMKFEIPSWCPDRFKE